MEQIPAGLLSGLIGGLFVLVLALLLPRRACPQCGKPLPKFRKPANTSQALAGGWTCPHCGCEVDRSGRITRGR